LSLQKAEKKLTGIQAELIDMSVEFEPTDSKILSIRGWGIKYVKSNEEFTFGQSHLAAPPIDGNIKLCIGRPFFH
jgi:hypothetical protein